MVAIMVNIYIYILTVSMFWDFNSFDHYCLSLIPCLLACAVATNLRPFPKGIKSLRQGADWINSQTQRWCVWFPPSNNLKNTRRNSHVILNSFKIPLHGRFTILTITCLDSTESFGHGSIPSLFLYNILFRSWCELPALANRIIL